MKIYSIKLTNYRIHREFEAAFDPSLTLIGGPNESGKSTLADAAYNALFMRARRGGADRGNIISRHGGNPEVELSFECSGRTYTLRKSFRGQQGTVVLSEHGGETWNGDAAEDKLLELCGVGAGDAGGRAIPTHWEHLWVRQGKAGLDPSAFATEKADTLLARLQDTGAAAMLQSALDSRVAGQFAGELAEIQTARGPKAGSELDNATRASTAATQTHQSAEAACVLLEHAATDFDQSTQELADADRNLIGLQSELSEIRQKLVRAGELRALLDRQRADANLKTEEFQRLAAGDESIRDARSRIASEAEALSPREASLTRATDAEVAARQACAEAETANADTSRRSRDVRTRFDLAVLCVKRFEQADLVSGLQRRTADARTLLAQLADLPAVTSAQVSSLQKLDRDREKLDSALATLGVSSLAEAVAAKTKRDEILVRLEGTESIEQELADAEARHAATEEEIRRRSAAFADFTPAADAAAATAVQMTCQVDNDEASVSEEAAAQRLNTCFKKLESTTKSVTSLREELQTGQKTLDGLKGQLTQLIFTHGEDTGRTARLADLAGAKKLVDTELATTQESFNALQPQVLEADETRLARAISVIQTSKISAGERLAVARNTLRREGTSDPRADLARAAASERSANDRLASAKRHADAIALLNSLFSAEQQSLTDQLTKPLADKVSGYLQCLFGPSAEARVTMTDGVFEALTLSRPGSGTFSFPELSGGAQEQTAIAFRLAMAEILAQKHNGCLPVFLDDAFTNSDGSRVALLQRMLDLAASRGLQIIVLSCSPNDYASLGAKTVMLQPPAAPPAAAPEISAASVRGDEQATSESCASGDGAVVDVTEDMKQKFLSALTASPQGRMGNASLRRALGWDEPTYNAVKNHLLASGQVVSGKGRGGSVSLAET